MPGFAAITFLLIGANIFISYRGFTNPLFMERYQFQVGKVRYQKEYIRILSSAFLHTGWAHLLFNMLALYAFGDMLETLEGSAVFLALYLVSLAGSKAITLLLHKSQLDYASVGASGAVNGIIYAAIALFPNMDIGFFILPLSVPAWAFGLAYVIFTIFGIRDKWGANGHAAHLGGALTGMLAAIALHPQVLQVNYLPIAAILLPTVGFLLLTIYKPEMLVLSSAPKKKTYASIDHEYNSRKALEQATIDSILEKVHKRGMGSLSQREKAALEQFSKKENR